MADLFFLQEFPRDWALNTVNKMFSGFLVDGAIGTKVKFETLTPG